MIKHLSAIVLLLLAACAPQMQDYDPLAAGKPRIASAAFHMADGVDLPYRSWLPKTKPKAIVVALHGFNDYSSSFQYSGIYFAAHGIAVYAYDQRGFGTAPQTGIWAGEQNLDRDLEQVVRLMHKRYPGTPLYVLGESMGGAVALTALSDPDFPKINGVILSAPAVWGGQTMSPIFSGTLWLVAHTIPYKTFTGSDLHILASNNIPMLRGLAADPLVIKATRGDALYGLVETMGDAYEDIPNVKLPVLMLYGGHDQVIPKKPVDSALARFTVPVRYVYYPNGYHMLLRDLEREEVMDDILSWIKHPDAPMPSGIDTLIAPGK